MYDVYNMDRAVDELEDCPQSYSLVSVMNRVSSYSSNCLVKRNRLPLTSTFNFYLVVLLTLYSPHARKLAYRDMSMF
jgi:hypothetical protein